MAVALKGRQSTRVRSVILRVAIVCFMSAASAACAAITGLSDFDEVGGGGDADASVDANANAETSTSNDAKVGQDGAIADASTDHVPPFEASLIDGSTPDVADAGLTLTSDPHNVTCGSSPCTVNNNGNHCCGIDCVANSVGCSNDDLACDEAADCDNGQGCCLQTDKGTFLKSTCDSLCDNNPKHVTICKLDSECAKDGNKKCLPVQCRNRTFGTCGGMQPQGCN